MHRTIAHRLTAPRFEVSATYGQWTETFAFHSLALALRTKQMFRDNHASNVRLTRPRAIRALAALKA